MGVRHRQFRRARQSQTGGPRLPKIAEQILAFQPAYPFLLAWACSLGMKSEDMTSTYNRPLSSIAEIGSSSSNEYIVHGTVVEVGGVAAGTGGAGVAS